MDDEKYQIDMIINPEGIESTQTQLRAMEKFIQQTEKRAKILDKIKINPVARIKDEITGHLAKIESRLKSLNSRTITVAIKAQDMTGNVRFGGGGAKKYAWGGVVTSPHLGMVGEAGPEAIIPLSSPMRSRAIDLWQHTGNMLGVPMHGKGGIFGRFMARAGDYIQAIPDKT